MTTLIEIRDLEVKRGGRVALQINALDVLQGETLAVIGPNGAGKSSLLLTLAKLLKPSRGRILFRGNQFSALEDLEYRRRISFVFQDPLMLDMSVEENIALGLKFRRFRREEIRRSAHQWMSQLGIDSLAKRRAGQVSGGEAQRISLARAFVLEPELLLLDEPFSALDPPTRANLLADVSALLSKVRQTAIFVTHDLKEAAQLSSRTAILIGGKLMQVGPFRQIKSKPVNAEVAAFLKTLT